MQGAQRPSFAGNQAGMIVQDKPFHKTYIMADNISGKSGTESGKTSTDPQENEIDSNVFKSSFRKLFGTTDDEAGQTPIEKEGEGKTVDEAQDPANE